MLWILSAIIILYVSSYIIFRKNQTFIKIRKWVDITTTVLLIILVVSWVEIFHYSFYFIIYFLISLSIIIYLRTRLYRTETKQKKAEETIKVLKDEEELLEAKLADKETEEIKK